MSGYRGQRLAIVVVCSFVLAITAPALCADGNVADTEFRIGRNSLEKGDFAEALRWFLKSAEKGNAVAQFNIGVMLYKGEGTPRDYMGALKWFRRAAELGHASAQANLGVMYLEGQGVDKEAPRYFTWVT